DSVGSDGDDDPVLASTHLGLSIARAVPLQVDAVELDALGAQLVAGVVCVARVPGQCALDDLSLHLSQRVRKTSVLLLVVVVLERRQRHSVLGVVRDSCESMSSRIGSGNRRERNVAKPSCGRYSLSPDKRRGDVGLAALGISPSTHLEWTPSASSAW